MEKYNYHTNSEGNTYTQKISSDVIPFAEIVCNFKTKRHNDQKLFSLKFILLDKYVK